ncbi:general secretion pathway protein GspK [Xylophilus sp. Kf1]|nr:general secretion pathway protein GspK [Xylophilus sp. Kf1]
MTRPTKAHRTQRGAALLAAMLTVTLVATLAASALWQQWRDVEIETSERARVQAAWMLSGALDWSRLILREDANARSSTPGGGQSDDLTEPWAVPLQEARLSSFLAADRNNTGDGSDDDDVFLSGAITDAQALFNLRNLVDDKNLIDEKWQDVLLQLFSLLNLPEQQARLIANGMKAALAPGATDAPLMPERLQELTWLGVSPATIETLRPYATILPARGTPINLNTAPAQVLAAVLGTSLSVGQRLVTARTNAPFRNSAEAEPAAGVALKSGEGHTSTTTQFFEVRGRLRLQQAVVEERSLVRRNGTTLSIVWRERAALGLQNLPAVAR